MPRCYACGKIQSSNTDVNVSFHRFPRDDSTRRVWLETIGRKGCIVNEETRICSLHFSENCFYYPKGGTGKQRRLKANSVPMIFQETSTQIQDKMTNQFETDHNNDMGDNNIQQLKIVEHNVEPMELVKHINVDPACENIVPNQGQITMREELESLNNFQLVECEKQSLESSVDIDTQPIVSPSTNMQETVVSSIDSTTACNSIDINHEGTMMCSTRPKTLRRKWMRTYNPRYIGDCNHDEFEFPRRALRIWSLAKKYIELQRKKLKCKQQHNRRLKKKLVDFKSLLVNLKKKNFISDDAYEVLTCIL